jgi:hypothetical protein
MKKLFQISAVSLLLIVILNRSNAQVQKRILVEHFTNSNCGACAATNPSFYSAFNNFPGALHISFHPSSPYASCIFSMSNPTENDARTNWYSIYGSTPRFVLNGVIANVGNMNSLLTTEAAKQSNFDIQCEQTAKGTDSISVKVTIKKVASDPMTTATLFCGVTEDTVFASTGNGESKHIDVFRKALTMIGGDAINLPVNINDSVIINYEYKVTGTWSKSRLRTLALLQGSSNKASINSTMSNKGTPTVVVPNSILDVQEGQLNIYPNPFFDQVFIQSELEYDFVHVYSATGNLVQTYNKGEQINLGNMPRGTYLLQILGKQGAVNKLILKN